MNAEELSRQIDAYRDGTISDADARLLAAAIRAGDETSRRIVRELEFEGLLGQALEGIDDESFVRSFNERQAAEREESTFLRAFEGRRAPARRSPARAAWLPFAIAAAALVAVAVVVVTSGSVRREPLKMVDAPPRAVAPVTPEPPEELPAPPREEPKVPEAPKSVPPRETPKPPEPPRPAPPPVVPVAPEKKTPPAPPKEVETRVAAASVPAARGDVHRLDGETRTPLAAGQSLFVGQGVECGPKGSAVALFADGTRVEIGPDTLIREVSDRKGKRVILVKGVVVVEAAKQPADAPMVFATPHGEARVLGTAFRLEVGAQTRLEVTEGKVRLTRTGGKAADVAAGSFAVAAPGVEPSARIAHPDEIVLPASQARIVGDEWVLMPDRNASSGSALQVAKVPFKAIDHVENRPSYAVFTFHASAEREYRLWMRSTSLATGDKWLREMATVDPRDCAMSQKSPFFGTAPTNAFVFTGLASWNGYAWSSGAFDEGKPDKEPIVLRFHKTGPQTIRVYTVHPSIRIDSIWLSTRQAARPAARTIPPPAESR